MRQEQPGRVQLGRQALQVQQELGLLARPVLLVRLGRVILARQVLERLVLPESQVQQVLGQQVRQV